jgi:hypothetical protein
VAFDAVTRKYQACASPYSPSPAPLLPIGHDAAPFSRVRPVGARYKRCPVLLVTLSLPRCERTWLRTWGFLALDRLASIVWFDLRRFPCTRVETSNHCAFFTRGPPVRLMSKAAPVGDHPRRNVGAITQASLEVLQRRGPTEQWAGAWSALAEVVDSTRRYRSRPRRSPSRRLPATAMLVSLMCPSVSRDRPSVQQQGAGFSSAKRLDLFFSSPYTV